MEDSMPIYMRRLGVHSWTVVRISERACVSTVGDRVSGIYNLGLPSSSLSSNAVIRRMAKSLALDSTRIC